MRALRLGADLFGGRRAFDPAVAGLCLLLLDLAHVRQAGGLHLGQGTARSLRGCLYSLLWLITIHFALLK